MAKLFTIEEAAEKIPRITEIFNEMYDNREKLFIVKKEIKWLKKFWGAELNEYNPDKEKISMLRDIATDVSGQILENIKELECIGCVIEDLEKGIINFYHNQKEELVFLCWSYGENGINHWHTLNERFERRKPIKDLIKKFKIPRG
ncbi:DUF2203 family protein [Candidatus Aenigmatarchaeota archaeon]